MLHPHLKPNFEAKRRDKAIVADTSTTLDQLSQILYDLHLSLPFTNPSSSSHTAGTIHASLASHSIGHSWVIDSDATDHMANSPSSLSDFSTSFCKHDVYLANGTVVHVPDSGKIDFFSNRVSSTTLVVPSFPP